jgi:SAM-dependent methyltransferase
MEHDEQDESGSRAVDPGLVALLRCPESGEPLAVADGQLVATRSGRRYDIAPGGIPLFAERFLSKDARAQQAHYDRVAAQYIANLGYSHTQEYTAYLDRAFLALLGPAPLGTLAEICCGRGEALRLVGGQATRALGVDVSLNMLQAARRDLADRRFDFVQGDATRLPLADAAIDTVVMFGGIHHVRDRPALFAEVARVLKPGGRFLWREPVSDFILWRALRAVIYRLSPALDHETERPLLWRETVPVMERAGLIPDAWQTYGFLGFCLFMNSDVLVFNRAFRFIPGIRAITRAAAALDELTRRIPGLGRAGLQVIGAARKPG